jgi:hypothetical protein
MQTKPFISIMALAAAVLLAACSSTPQRNSALEDARADYLSAQSDPGVAKYASAELRQASDALGQADTAWAGKKSVSTVDNLAYVARQKTETARQMAKQKSA